MTRAGRGEAPREAIRTGDGRLPAGRPEGHRSERITRSSHGHGESVQHVALHAPKLVVECRTAEPARCTPTGRTPTCTRFCAPGGSTEELSNPD
jgi:hypothetical protein